ncbi:MAG: hypothetical protein JRC86_12325, partial [Deltaproteobacteria bacterium]|nr:hypothetical protein [Deltaproteobacteria bacterium]
MRSKYICIILVTVFLCFIPVMLLADIVYLNTGGKVEGKIVERTIDGVKVKTVKGTVDIPADDIDRIEECESVFDIYEKKLKGTPENDVDARFELGLWCEKKGLDQEAWKHFGEAIELSPDHEKARAMLGYVKTANGWEIPPEPEKKPSSAAKPENQPVPPVAKKPEKPKVEPRAVKKKPGKVFPKRDPGIYKESFTYRGQEQPVVIR